jgi:DNA gyrase subunit B
VEKAPPDKMLAHEEIRAIITALGIGIDDELDLSKLRYYRVILMTDADVDGSHIRTLLLTFFFRHMVELINHQHLYIAQPPLYRVSKGKTSDWLYSEEGLNKFYIKKAFENVSVYSKDKSMSLTGEDLMDYFESLKEINQDIETLAKEAKIPRELGEFLLKKDKDFHRLDFFKQESMLEAMRWLNAGGFPTKSSSNPITDEYSLEVELKRGNIKFDKNLLENPTLHRCFIAYPKVKHFIENKSYFVIKNKREIGTDIPWYKVVELLDKTPDRSNVVIQRYKGLGEMSAEQLWETTMNPTSRTLLEVAVDDAARADRIFHILMGDEVPPRKAFIQAHARSVKNLDI